MENLVINTNKHLINESYRNEEVLKSAIASFNLEGIEIPKEYAREILNKLNKDLKKSVL